LTHVEREELLSLISKTRVSAKKSSTARILLKADAGDEGESWSNDKIASAFEISVRSVVRLRKRFVEEGLEATLNRKVYPKTRQTKLDGEEEAHLIAICCGAPPSGRAKWTLRLLADKLVALKIVDSVSHETIRQTLKKTSLG
jgi:transposase